jgi:sortase A
MTMQRASGFLRRLEICLWIAGAVLCGVALAATLNRWKYQRQQERALFTGGPAVSSPAPTGPIADAPPPEAGPLPPRPAAVSAPPAAAKRSSAPAPRQDAFARIEIPRLRLKAMVKEGGDEKTLSRAVGLIPGSAKPGTNGNTVLAGHRDTFFRPLQKIKVNDQIRLTVPPNTYEYRVQWVSVVSPDDTELLKSRGTEELTLVTCYPFSMIGPAPDRFIVNAVRIN